MASNVLPLKLEATDEYPTPINPNEDAIDGQGVYLGEDSSILRTADDDMLFVDGIADNPLLLSDATQIIRAATKPTRASTGYELGCIWFDTRYGDYWYLAKKLGSFALWLPVYRCGAHYSSCDFDDMMYSSNMTLPGTTNHHWQSYGSAGYGCAIASYGVGGELELYSPATYSYYAALVQSPRVIECAYDFRASWGWRLTDATFVQLYFGMHDGTSSYIRFVYDTAVTSTVYCHMVVGGSTVYSYATAVAPGTSLHQYDIIGFGASVFYWLIDGVQVGQYNVSFSGDCYLWNNLRSMSAAGRYAYLDWISVANHEG